MNVRILFLSQVLPYPLDSGVKIRSYYMLRTLAESHEVTLISFARDDNTSGDIAHLQEICRRVLTVPMRRTRTGDARFLIASMVTGRSFIIGRDSVGAMAQLVNRVACEAAAAGVPFDAVHSDQLWMAQYALRVQGAKRVLDQHNAVYLIPQRMAAQASDPVRRRLLLTESKKLARYEGDTCRAFDHLFTVTDDDRRALLAVAGGRLPPSTVVPICVDPAVTTPVARRPGSRTVLHLGTMYWPPNVAGVLWFGQEVFPVLKTLEPEARLCVVGKKPPRAVRALAADPAIAVTGYVADPRPHLANSAALIVPVHAGGGMRVKILEGWLWGLPIVSTSIGAEGITCCNGEDLLIADDAAHFAKALARVLNDDALAERLAASGRRRAEASYDWRRVYGAVNAVYRELERR